MTKYTDRAMTPLGNETGLTSTPVSLRPSRSNSPKSTDPYVYQPAAMWTHPNAVPGPTANYLEAVERERAPLGGGSGVKTGGGEVAWGCGTEEGRPGLGRKVGIKWRFVEGSDRKGEEANG